MPLNAIVTTPIFLSMLTSNLIVGIQAPRLALALASGLEIYAGSGLKVQSIDTGTAGSGIGTGIGVTITVPALVGGFTASFASRSILGIMSPLMINALSLSFALIMQQGIVNTVSAGVGVGAGVTKLIPNPVASLAAFTAGFASAGLTGPGLPPMISAIAQGFDTAASTAVGVVAIAGPPSPIPSAGTGFGIIF